MIPDIALAMDHVRELHPRDLPKIIERIEALTSDCWEYKFGKTIITLDGNRNRIWIESPEYGHFTYQWGSPGESFKSFVTGLNKQYVLGKFKIEEVFDKRATFAALRNAINEIDVVSEVEFEKGLKRQLSHMQDICDSSREFVSQIDELNRGSMRQYYWLNDDSIQIQFEDIFSEPWNFICTKESVTARKLWKDFEKLQSKLRKEAESDS